MVAGFLDFTAAADAGGPHSGSEAYVAEKIRQYVHHLEPRDRVPSVAHRKLTTERNLHWNARRCLSDTPSWNQAVVGAVCVSHDPMWATLTLSCGISS